MKIVELINHISVALTNEEADVLSQFSNKPIVTKKELSEREVVLANQLVVKDILTRRKNNGVIEYCKKGGRS